MAAEVAAMRGMQNSIMQAKQRNIQELRKLYNLYRPKREKRVKKKAESEYTLKEKVHCLLDPTALFPNEKYHNVSIAISLSIFVIIFISIVTFVLESVPEYESKQTYQIIESICVTIFTVEFMLKLSTCPSFRLFVRDLYNWIDLISILPFYVDIFVEAVLNRKNNVNLLFLRVIRLARIFRMFKLGKYNKPFGMVLLVVINSIDALFLLVFMLLLSVILFSSLQWMAEQSSSEFDPVLRLWIREDGSRSPFQSIPHAFWWCFCTLTTVGYGDEVPVSGPGKLVAGVTIIVGVFVMAFPVILISYNYSEMMQKNELSQLYRGRLKNNKRSRARREHSHSVGSLSLSGMSGGGLLLGNTAAQLQSNPLDELPDIGARVSSWRKGGRILGLYYNGLLGQCPSFCFDPPLTLLHPALVTARPKCLSSGTELMHYSLLLSISGSDCVLRGLRAVNSLAPFSKMRVSNEFIFARKVVSLEASIPNLPEGMYLAEETWSHPGEAIQINIMATETNTMEVFVKRLAEYSLHLTLSYRSVPLGAVRGINGVKEKEKKRGGLPQTQSFIKYKLVANSSGTFSEGGTSSKKNANNGIGIGRSESFSGVKPAQEEDNKEGASVSRRGSTQHNPTGEGRWADDLGFICSSERVTLPLAPLAAPPPGQSTSPRNLRNVIKNQCISPAKPSMRAVLKGFNLPEV